MSTQNMKVKVKVTKKSETKKQNKNVFSVERDDRSSFTLLKQVEG